MAPRRQRKAGPRAAEAVEALWRAVSLEHLAVTASASGLWRAEGGWWSFMKWAWSVAVKTPAAAFVEAKRPPMGTRLRAAQLLSDWVQRNPGRAAEEIGDARGLSAAFSGLTPGRRIPGWQRLMAREWLKRRLTRGRGGA